MKLISQLSGLMPFQSLNSAVITLGSPGLVHVLLGPALVPELGPALAALSSLTSESRGGGRGGAADACITLISYNTF